MINFKNIAVIIIAIISSCQNKQTFSDSKKWGSDYNFLVENFVMNQDTSVFKCISELEVPDSVYIVNRYTDEIRWFSSKSENAFAFWNFDTLHIYFNFIFNAYIITRYGNVCHIRCISMEESIMSKRQYPSSVEVIELLIDNCEKQHELEINLRMFISEKSSSSEVPIVETLVFQKISTYKADSDLLNRLYGYYGLKYKWLYTLNNVLE